MDDRRLTGTFGSWRRSTGLRRSLDRSSWWRKSETGHLGFGLSAVALGLTFPVEAALWRMDGAPAALLGIGRVPGGLLAALFLATWAFGVPVFDGLLQRRLPGRGARGPLSRAVRATIVAFPGLGVTSVAFWRQRALAAGRLARSDSPSNGDEPAGARLEIPTRWRGLGETVPFRVWMAGMGSLVAGVLWISDVEALDVRRATVLVLLAIAFHLLGLLGLVAYLRHEPAHVGSRWAWTWALAWLAPLPLALAAYVPLYLEIRSRRGETLVARAFSRRGDAGELEAWSRLEGVIRELWAAEPWWRRWRRPIGRRESRSISIADRMLFRVARIKVSLLLGDGLIAGWLLHGAGLGLFDPPWIGWCSLMIVAAWSAGCAIAVARLLLTSWKVLEEPGPLGLHLQAGYGAFGLGWLILGSLAGSGFAMGSHRQAGLAIVSGLAVTQALIGLGHVVRSGLVTWEWRQMGGEGSVWAAFVASWIGATVAVRWPVGPPAVVTVAIVVPVLHLVCFVRIRRFVDHLFRADAGRRGARSRAFLLATSLVPCGGLVVPGWFRIREREAADPGGGDG